MSTSPRISARFAAILVAAWCVAFAVALCVDAPVAAWVRSSGTGAAVAASHWSWWVKLPGGFPFTAVVVGLLWLARRVDGRGAVFVIAVAAMAGLNVIPKWIVGRTRPFKLPIPVADQPRPFQLHPFHNGLRGLFHEVNLSFPSGHECTAFALAAAVWFAWRPGSWVLLALAAAVGVERVVENAHYASDVIGAVGFAGGCAWVAWLVLGGWINHVNPPEISAPSDPPGNL
jgi:membrane-associated phospholipid phosphatase